MTLKSILQVKPRQNSVKIATSRTTKKSDHNSSRTYTYCINNCHNQENVHVQLGLGRVVVEVFLFRSHYFLHQGISLFQNITDVYTIHFQVCKKKDSFVLVYRAIQL